MSLEAQNTYTFRTRSGNRLVIKAHSYEDALFELADKLGVTLVGARISRTKPEPDRLHFENNVIPLHTQGANKQ